MSFFIILMLVETIPNINELKKDEKVRVLVEENYCPEAAYLALKATKWNINKARHLLFQGLISNNGTKPESFQADDNGNKNEELINDLKPELVVETPNENPTPENSNFEDTIYENEQVQVLISEGYSPEDSFRALLDSCGNISKARKILIRNKKYNNIT